MQIAPHGAVVPLHISLWVHCHLGLLGVKVEPVRDVCACGINQGPAGLKMNVLLNKLGEVVDLAVEADPAVIRGAVLRNLLGRVVLAELVGARQVSGVLLARQL